MKPASALCFLGAAALTLWILAAWWLVPDSGMVESMIALQASIEAMNDSVQAANAAMDSAIGCMP